MVPHPNNLALIPMPGVAVPLAREPLGLVVASVALVAVVHPMTSSLNYLDLSMAEADQASRNKTHEAKI